MSQAVIEQDWDRVASLAADLHDAHARLVDFVATVLAEGSWQAAGLRSPEHWLTLRAGLSRGQAAAVVLLARRQAELPATSAALREGRISLDQAATVGGRPRVTWADALVLMATRSLEAGTADVPGRRARYRVQVYLDTDGGWLTGRPRLPRGIVDALTCDGTLTPVWETEGHAVNVGRTQRVVPPRTRVLVLDRDRGCRFPGCGTGVTAHLEVHHLLHWRDGGATDLSNLLCLCTFHHDAHHRGEFSVTGDPTRPDGLEFLTQHGLLIGPPARPSLLRTPTPAPAPLSRLPRAHRSTPAPATRRLHPIGSDPTADVRPEYAYAGARHHPSGILSP